MLKLFSKRDVQKGFTLIELMIVVAIIGILAAIAVPQFIQYRARGWIATVQADVKLIESDFIGWSQANPGVVFGGDTVSNVGGVSTPGALLTTSRVSPGVTVTLGVNGYPVTGTHVTLQGSYVKNADGTLFPNDLRPL